VDLGVVDGGERRPDGLSMVVVLPVVDICVTAAPSCTFAP